MKNSPTQLPRAAGFTRTTILTATLAFLLGFSLPASAETEETPDYADTRLSGDWSGKRSALWGNGWDFGATLKVDALQQIAGAMPGGGVVSNLDLTMNADLSRIAGMDGATAFLHIIDNRGASINEWHGGSLMGVSNIEVPIPTTTIFQAWIQQNFLDDRLSVLAGLYPIDTEFFTMESAGTLIHPAFGAPADLAMTHGPSIFNRSSFGLRGKWQSEDRTLYAMGSILDGYPAYDPDHPTFAPDRVSGGHGAFTIAEIGLLPDECAHLFETSSAKKPEAANQDKYAGTSKYAVGFWRYSKRMPDQLDVDANGDPMQTRSQGAYLLAERTLFSLGSPERDVTAFARYSTSDGDSTPIDNMWNLGVRLRGPVSSRPDDELAIGWTRAHLAPKYRAVQLIEGVDTAASESIMEVSWRAAITPWLALQPVLQVIQNPGGDSAAPRATFIGTRIELEI